MRLLRRLAITMTLATAISFQAACGAANFAQDLRLSLALAGPVIESLNLGDKKAAIIADFTDLGNGAATMADAINTCAGSKPCELNAVSAFDQTFEMVVSRGHLGVSPKLTTIEGIVRGIIASAKIYYGQAPKQTIGAAKVQKTPAQAKADIQAGLKRLKAEMQPVR